MHFALLSRPALKGKIWDGCEGRHRLPFPLKVRAGHRTPLHPALSLISSPDLALRTRWPRGRCALVSKEKREGAWGKVAPCPMLLK